MLGSVPSVPANEFGGALQLHVALRVGENICSCWTRSLGFVKCQNVFAAPTHVFDVYSPGKLFSGCKCRPISVKRNPKIEANVAVSERTVCYRVVFFYYILRDYFLHLFWRCPNIQNSRFHRSRQCRRYNWYEQAQV